MRALPLIAIVSACLLIVSVGVGSPELAAAPASMPSAASSPTADNVKQSQEVIDAITLFKKGDYEGTLKLLKEAAKKNPELPPAHLILAQFFSQAGNNVAARNALEQAVVESPNDPQSYAIMAEVAVRDRRVTEALMLYSKATSLATTWNAPEDRKRALQSQIHYGLAIAFQMRGDWASAQKEIEAWLKLDPKNASALQELARCLFQQRNPDGALAKLKEAARIDPSVLLPETTLAQYYSRSGDQENAKKWLVAALTAAPKDVKTRLVAAQWAFELGDLEEAKKQATGAHQLDPKSLNAKNLCGVIALFQKDYKAAELYFESAHLQSPKNFVATNNLALALAEQKDKKKTQRALEYAEGNARQYPRQSDALSTYGWVLYKAGRLEDAENALRAAAATGNFGPDAAYYLACVLSDRGQEPAARQLLESALKSPGPFPQKEEAQALLNRLKK